MNRGPKGRYTKEFREQAVKLVLVDGLSQREVAGRLSLSVKTLGAWVVAERKGTLTKVGETQKPQSELEAELARVKRELATVTMERDILKNRPTRLGATLMNRNFRGVHLMRAETVAACFLEVSTPSKNLAQGKLRTHLWRRLRTTPFRKLIYSESPSCA